MTLSFIKPKDGLSLRRVMAATAASNAGKAVTTPAREGATVNYSERSDLVVEKTTTFRLDTHTYYRMQEAILEARRAGKPENLKTFLRTAIIAELERREKEKQPE